MASSASASRQKENFGSPARRLFAWPFYLLLLPLFAVLHVANTFRHLTDAGLVWKEWLALFLAPLLLYGVSALLTRPRNAAAAALLPVLVFFFGGAVKKWLDGQPVGWLHSYLFWTLLLLAALPLYFRWTRRKPRQAAGLVAFVNAVSVVYLLIELAGWITFSPATNYLGDPARSREQAFQPCTDCPTPDIYHFIFDEYAAERPLKALGYDNAALYDFLREKGFYIAGQSRANYRSTMLSMSSLFNMQYHRGLDTSKPLAFTDYLRGQYTLRHSELFPILRKQGYTIRNFSWLPIAGTPNELPRYDYWGQRSLYRPFNLVSYTLHEIGWRLPPALRVSWEPGDAEYINWRDAYHRSIIRAVDTINAARTAAPLYFYGHFQLPHPPYVYDSLGRRRPDTVRTKAGEVRGYIEQVGYTNRVIRHLVTTLQARQPKGRPLVIILQSDHGFRVFDRKGDAPGFENLAAFYFSNGDFHLLRPDLSNVNTYPVLLNTFFRTHYPLLPDHTYYPEGEDGAL
ncbi:MAG: hypothetical protein EOO16_02920 [Chitinophagaceae bacterium]|nr:MAG: hypothetical protein EOO16_02920 [Chitinophagaceae bacterium]